MADEIELINPITGLPITLTFDEYDWHNNLAFKAFTLFYSFAYIFVKDENGEISILYFEQTFGDEKY